MSNNILLQETQFSLKGTHRLRIKGWKKTFQTNGNQKGNIVMFKYTYVREIQMEAILISDKTYFKIKAVRKRQRSFYK